MSNIRPIQFVQYGCLTGDEWRKFAIKIDRPHTRGGPIENTPYDERLGALKNNVTCQTCGELNIDGNSGCPGHFGYIDLPEPVYNPSYMDYIVSILKCVCPICYSSRIKSERANKLGFLHHKMSARLKEMKKYCEKIDRCPQCQSPLPFYCVDKTIIYRYYDDKESKKEVSEREVLTILSQISNETMKLLGFNEQLSPNKIFMNEDILPENYIHMHQIKAEAFIFTALPIIPPPARPWVVKNGELRDDDLTEKYNVILKLVNKLKNDSINTQNSRKKNKKITEKDKQKDKIKTKEEIKHHIWTLIDNSKDKAKVSNGGRSHKGIKDRIIRKEGHMQTNVAGKRVDFSARTVIVGGGPLLPSGWIGIPEYVAKILTESELVTEWNIDHYRKLLKENKINVIKRQGNFINVKKFTDDFKKPYIGDLRIYDIIERQLQDGDWGIFNRQPTLRIESMIGVQLKILQGYVFRLPLNKTRELNADFDGDECNLHIVQSRGSRAECSVVMANNQHIISRQNNAPIQGCVQNTLIAMYIMTNIFETKNPNDEHSMDGVEDLVSFKNFCDMIMAANISNERYFELASRAKKYYPDFIELKEKRSDGECIWGFKEYIPGKLAVSIVFPPDFTFSKETGTNERYKEVKIKNGVLLPDSGPLCKKTIGCSANSTVHYIWKMYSPSRAEKFISELQFIGYIYLPRHGFSMGISDCLTDKESYKKIKRKINEILIECEIINSSLKSEQEKEFIINSNLNKAIGIATDIAKTSMNKKDRNSLIIMTKSGAKGSYVNIGQIVALVGQQNVDNKRPSYMLSNNTRTLPHFLPNDKRPMTRGFVESSFLKGLKYYEVYFHAIGGRRGVVDTALKTANTGYLQKKIVKKIEDLMVQADGSVRDAAGNIIEFMYGGDGMNAKKLIYTKGIDFPFFINAIVLADMLNSQFEFSNCEFSKDDNLEKRKLSKEEIDLILSYINTGCPGIQSEVVKRATYNIRLILRNLLLDVLIYEPVIFEFCKQLRDYFEESKAPIGEMVGLIAASSIGEPSTQLTLNSIEWKSRVIIRQKNTIYNGSIGNFIDKLLEKKKNVKYLENETEYKDVKYKNLETICVDEDGKMHWKSLEAITRHLPGGKLIKIKTRGGRTVSATQSKSLLVRKNNKIVPIKGSDIKVGDLVPICMKFPETKNELKELDMRQFFPPSEYIYASEMRKMIKCKFENYTNFRRKFENYTNFRRGGQCWWKNGVNTKFIVPYNRSDIAMVGYNKYKEHYKSDVIFPRIHASVKSKFPEKLKLDRLCGFFFGAYLAEGCATKNYISISNNDKKFRKRIEHFCDRYNIGYHTVIQKDKNFKGATSTDIRIHSILLAKLVIGECQTGLKNKNIPSWSLISNKSFIKGLLDGYFSGDGTINKRDLFISASSKKLLVGISDLCSKFGIFGKISKYIVKENNVGSKKILPVNTFSIQNNFATIFANNISLVIVEKQRRLDLIKEKVWIEGNGRYDIIPGINTSLVKGSVHRKNLKEMFVDFEDNEDNANQFEKDIIKNTLDMDVYFDEIMEITKVESLKPKVYDLTVKDTKNFTLAGGLCVRDTFHSSGISAKDVTLGVPRLTELLNASKKPSKPACTIYFNDNTPYLPTPNTSIDLLSNNKKFSELVEKYNLDKSNEKLEDECLRSITNFGNHLILKRVKDFLIDYELLFLPLPDGNNSVNSSPINIITYEEYKEEWWVKLWKDLGNYPKIEPASWVIILEFDIDKLYQFGITLDQIAEKIEHDSFGSRNYAMACVPSPLNIGKIEVYLNFSEIKEYVRPKIDLPEKGFLTDNNIEFFTAKKVAIKFIKSIELEGISGITKIYPRYNEITKEWSIDTQGTNFQDILNVPGVNFTKTVTDDMWEILNILGIEAARKFLIKAITSILSFDGTYINPRHITLLVDSMTRTSTITSVNRYGIGRTEAGPLAKQMFEKAVDNAAESSAFGEVDFMKGVSASVMFGTLSKVGTGSVEVKDKNRLPVKVK